MYKNIIKRCMDIIISFIGIVILMPLFIIISIVGALSLKGNPFFVQPRPGKDGKIFYLLKFRSMNNKTDENGVLLSDKERLTKYGKWLRHTSLDETLELFNIISGDMAFVGPRPFLVKDYVFMSEKIKERHYVRPGLTGLAQVNGRNNMSWEEKFEYDLEYIDNISFLFDCSIFVKTILKVLGIIKVKDEEIDLSEDYGDYLLHSNRIDLDEYNKKIEEAKKMLENKYE